MNALQTLIHKGESISDGYNAYNKGTSHGHIIGADKKIIFSKMTIITSLNTVRNIFVIW